MGPIEILYLTIGIIVVLIGLARGYVKELGSTLIILVALFILTFFKEPIDTALGAAAQGAFGAEDGTEPELLLSLFYTFVFVGIVFAGYAGRTLTFGGQPAPPPQGLLLSLLVGIINGYLIAGTLWYYQEAYGYPFFRPFQSEFTEAAQTMIAFLPPSLFEDNPVYWIIPVAILLIIRVRG
jgi:hypothetical protein